jgi:hypothetical protein
MPVFSRTMSTLLFVGAVTAAMPFVAVAAPYGEAAMFAARSGMPALHLAARKGTRNFRPDDAGAPDAGAAGAPSAATPPSKLEDKPETPADSGSLEGCMATWDKGTHISKSRWREICQRNANDREAGAAR